MEIEPVYLPYWKWEDTLMYHPPKYESEEERQADIDTVISFFSDQPLFRKTSKEMVKAYPNACIHNLTKTNMNRIAYIGQASVFFKYGIPEEVTREAWGYIPEETRRKANSTAKETLDEWEIEYIKDNDGQECLFSGEGENFLDF